MIESCERWLCSCKRPTAPEHRHIADKYAGESCSLDGARAVIGGRLHRFATVATLDPPHISAEFAWGVVELVMTEKGGRFHT